MKMNPQSSPWGSAKPLPIWSGPEPMGMLTTRAPHLAAAREHFATLYRRGKSQHRAGRGAEAVVSLTEALRIAPERAEAWSFLGVVHAIGGRFDEALACYNKALTIDPNQPETLSNKGTALVALGRRRDALVFYDRALTLNSRVASVHYNRGAVLREIGRLEDALASFDQALAIDRNHLRALGNRGNVLLDTGRAAEALESYDGALLIDPACAETLSNRGNALFKLGRPLEALRSCENALALDPNFADAHNNRGNALRDLRRYSEAIASFERAIALTPNNVGALNNLANTLMALRRPKDALIHYDAAIRIKPDFAMALSNRARALTELERPDCALSSVDEALAFAPGDPDAHNVRGNALLALDRHAEALESYDRAIALQPSNPLPHNNKGFALLQTGQIEEATVALETAIRLSPSRGKAYYDLAQAKKFQVDDPSLLVMEALVQRSPPLEEEDLTHLHFALGKAFEDVKNYERSFHHLSVGNAAKRRQSGYDETRVLDTLARTCSTYEKEMISRGRIDGNPSPLPIFIVGMPRSGSTLVEQVLGSHREVHAAGEINDFYLAMSRLGGAVAEALTLPEAVSRISGEQLSRLGTNYVDSLVASSPAASRIVNKMLGNFRYVGLIALALPGARFIHMRRDPIDACLSCFATPFWDNIPYAYDLGELGRYYRAYDAVMDVWRSTLPPGAMLEVQYESVVDDLEGQARRIVEHCGLDWDPACVDFQHCRRTVRTASFVQVRRPLYRSSVGRWRAYEPFLGPLLEQFPIR